jgi:hypothetical protein
VRFNKLTWVSMKRYKEFAEMHAKVIIAPTLSACLRTWLAARCSQVAATVPAEARSQLPKLPAKTLMPVFDPVFLTKRREALDAYLRELVRAAASPACPRVRSSRRAHAHPRRR